MVKSHVLEISHKQTYHLYLKNTFCIYISSLQHYDYDTERFEITKNNLKEICDKYNIEYHNFILDGIFLTFETYEEMWGFWNNYCDEEKCPYAVMFSPASQFDAEDLQFIDDFDKENGILINENT